MTLVLDARTVTDHFPGIGRYVVNLAHALKSIAPDLDLTLLRDPNARSPRLALPNLPTAYLPASPFAIQQQWRVPRQLHDLKATLYHSPYYLMPYRPGVPTVLTAYDVIPLIYPQYYTVPQRLIFRLAHDLALRTARTVLAISEATKRDLIQRLGVPASKIVVTPLAADPCFRPQTADRIAAVRAAYHLPDRYILYFGSNKPHKNLARLVAAFSNLQFPASNFHLVIAGAWDARYNDAKQLAANNDRIHFLGPVRETDLPALYGGATAFASVSEYEGFGLPPLEAMACGTPVIASNTSSLPEVIGDAGLLIDPRDVNAIAGALERVLGDADLQRELKQRSLDRAAQFSWARTAQQTLDVYQSIVMAN
ncbi:MAG TPA: glycosyltransferase family 1 protein [Anaerolineae bacterium]|nr:glycosyltransferase family 1 protein [Anaerolineae bacterium]